MTVFVFGSMLWFAAMVALAWVAACAFDARRNGHGFALVAVLIAMGLGWFAYVWQLGEVAS